MWAQVGLGASGTQRTPLGTDATMSPCPPSQRGDEVQCEIEELGTICNRVV